MSYRTPKAMKISLFSGITQIFYLCNRKRSVPQETFEVLGHKR